MRWERMRFRDQAVLVKVGDDGRPLLDSEGRAEMKYREGDPRSYRPAAGNLGRWEGPVPEEPPRRPRKGATTGRRAAGPSDAQFGADTVHVWTDGACTGNPGPMGIGMVVFSGDRRNESGEYLGFGTNNIAELTAIERGLELAAGLFGDGSARPVRVYSDSAYAIGLLSQGWKAKANQALVERLRQRVAMFPVIGFVKVAGHAGVVENERCDELARRAIQTKGTV